MKRFLISLLSLCSMSIALFAQVDIVAPDGSYYYPQEFEKPEESGGSDVTMYLALQDKDGNILKTPDVTDYTLAAYVDGVCRSVAVKQYNNTSVSENNPEVMYFIRVMYAPAGSQIKLRLFDSATKLEYEFAQAYTVTGSTQTIGNQPSNPEVLTFIPLESLNFDLPMDDKTRILTVAVGETKKIPLVYNPTDHTPLVNCKVVFDYANSVGYFDVNAETSEITGKMAAQGWLDVFINNTKNNQSAYMDGCEVTVTEAVQNVEGIEKVSDIILMPLKSAVLADYYTITPENATNKNVTAVIPEEGVDIAYVDQDPTNGSLLVTAMNPGTTYVTVTTVDGSKSVEIPITVMQPVEGIEKPSNAPEGTVVVPVGTILGADVLPYTIVPENAAMQEVRYRVENLDPAVEAVSFEQNGTNNPRPLAVAPGYAIVYIIPMDLSYDPDMMLGYIVQVVDPITEISVAADNQTIWTNETVTMWTKIAGDVDWYSFTPEQSHIPNFTFATENGTPVNESIIRTWVSSDTSTIGRKVYIEAYQPGVYNMTITTNQGFNAGVGTEVSKTIKVTAQQPVTAITGPYGETDNSNSPIEIIASVGEDITEKLAYIIEPEDATDKSVTYEVASTALIVEVVNEDGTQKVIARNEGTDDITIRPNGCRDADNLSVVYRVTVTDDVKITGIVPLFEEITLHINAEPEEGYYVREGEWFNFDPIGATGQNVIITCEPEIMYFEPDADPETPVESRILLQEAGVTTVTITSEQDPSISCSMTVKVLYRPTDIMFDDPMDKMLYLNLDEVVAMPQWYPHAADHNGYGVAQELIDFNPQLMTFKVTAEKYQNEGEELPSTWNPVAISDDQANIAGHFPGVYDMRAVYTDGEFQVETSNNSALSIVVRPYIDMQAGWNWIAVNNAANAKNYFPSDDNTAFDVMKEVFGTDLIEARSATEVAFNDSEWGWFGPLARMEMYQGYKARLADNKEYDPFVWNGELYNWRVEIDETHEYTLNEGWNWVGFNNIFPAAITDVILTTMSKDTRILGQESFCVFDGTSWTGSLEKLQPNAAYMIYIPEGGTTTLRLNTVRAMGLPEFSFSSTSAARESMARENENIWQYNMRKYANNMNIIAICDGDVAVNPQDYTIGAFVGNECRGEGVFTRGFWFVTLGGEANENVSFRLYNKRTDSYTNISNQMSFTTLAGSLDKPIMFVADIGTTGVGEILEGQDFLIDSNVIHFGNSCNGTAKVYDLSGRTITTHATADGALNIQGLPAGTYIITIITEDGVRSKKFSK